MASRVLWGCAAAAALWSGSVGAACTLKEYTVTGTALGADGSPVAGALVEATWEEKQAGIASTRTRSAADGRFTLTIQFDPYSSRSFGGKERCDAELAQVRVRARAEGGRGAAERSVVWSPEPPDISLKLE
jgi:hypothetical protein